MAIGLGIGSVSRSTNVTRIELVNKDGSSAGTITFRPAAAKKKPKKLSYSFKRLSNQIMRAKSSINAKQLTTKSKFQIADLRLKLASGDYDYTEVHNAIKHAERIARVAKKKMKNLQEEEFYEKNGKKSAAEEELEEQNEDSSNGLADIDTSGMSQEELERLMKQIQEEMEKIEKELEEAMNNSDNLLSEFMQSFDEEMSPEDLEALKRKHRADEMRDIMEADLEYLKAHFEKLAKEKSEGSSDSASSDSETGGNISGVTLELGGVEVPVETTSAAELVEGGSFDAMA